MSMAPSLGQMTLCRVMSSVSSGLPNWRLMGSPLVDSQIPSSPFSALVVEPNEVDMIRIVSALTGPASASRQRTTTLTPRTC